MPDFEWDWNWNWDWVWAMDAGWGQLALWDLALRLAMATTLGGLVGLERERLDRAAGLRTHALVSVASALMMIVSTYGFPLPPEGVDGVFDPGRIAAQVVSGIGFLGAGVIIFRDNTVRGLTTAATLWAVAGVGLAAGGGLYLAAVVATAFMLLIQAGLKPLERRFFAKHARLHRVVLEVDRGADVLEGIELATGATPVRLRSMEFDHDRTNSLETIELALMADRQEDVLALLARLRRIDAVRHITYKQGASIVRKRERLVSRRVDEDEDDENGRR
jgi:putative Mg2+ transporter-C (MgtC) family protein